MRGEAEIEKILGKIDEEPVLGKNVNFDKMPEFQRLKKTQFTINQMIGDTFREGYGIDGVTLDNIEMVYDPLVSGIGSLHKRK